MTSIPPSLTHARENIYALLAQLPLDSQSQLDTLAEAINEYVHAATSAVLDDIESVAFSHKERATALPRTAAYYRYIARLRYQGNTSTDLAKINEYLTAELARMTDFCLAQGVAR